MQNHFANAAACAGQVIRMANAEVAKGLQNPLYKLWQKLPGTASKGQAAISQFHSMMNDLLQEVTLNFTHNQSSIDNLGWRWQSLKLAHMQSSSNNLMWCLQTQQA